MDDFISGNDDENEVARIKQTSTAIFDAAGMTLGKWRSNSDVAHENPDESLVDETQSLCLPRAAGQKILGLLWVTTTDHLSFNLTSLLKFVAQNKDTKRFILQTAAIIFDPNGFLSPYTIRIKVLFQELWLIGSKWDDHIPTEISHQWMQWCSELPLIQHVSIPRYYFEGPKSEITELQLHVFGDASDKAYGAVAYLRYTTIHKEIETVLICARTRVAPLKKLSIPRLELMAAVLVARLSKYLKATLNGLTVNRTVLWTDSMITLHWLRGQASRWKTFVANRVQEIQELTDPMSWTHCAGDENPADLLTRGLHAENLTYNPIWWKGPAWLREADITWPRQTDSAMFLIQGTDPNSELKEPTPEVYTNEVALSSLLDLDKYSSLNRVMRITGWVLRFIRNCQIGRGKSGRATGPLGSEEIQIANLYWIKVTQFKWFKEEILNIQGNKSLGNKSKIRDLNPYLDQHGLLCLKGRLQEANLTIRQREPWLLPNKDRFTILIINQTHERLLHGGINETLTEIRENYWIIKARRTVKGIISKCLKCKRRDARPYGEIMAPLPRDRTIETPPFQTCGLDFAGPLYVKVGGKIEKSYILLITCAVTRAIHLELVSSLNTASFLLGFKKFVGRRGLPTVIYSDNAKTFQLANQKFSEMWKNLDMKGLQDYFCTQGIRWKFIVERAPWWGGFYERLVGLVKNRLKIHLGRASLTYEEMEAALVEVEAVLNSRPLTFISDNEKDPLPLTPSHFLVGNRLTCMPPPERYNSVAHLNVKRRDLLRRQKFQESLVNMFWRRWVKEYLLQLRSAYSYSTSKEERKIKVDDVVTIHEDKLPKHLWRLGRVIDTQTGRDGRIRSCLLKTSSGSTIRRPIQLLSPLEILD